MHIGLFHNKIKKASVHAFQKAQEYLIQQGITLSVFQEQEVISEHRVNKLDLAITFGGDGALLHAVHRLGINHPPLVGVNVGSLGFLAEISPEYLEESLQLICLGNYSLTEQIILELKDEKGPAKFAVNEIAFHRECVHNLIDLNIMVDGKLFNTFSSDGLIIATPAGSTAYSLAAGGPIVAPNLNAIIITPICPHTISNRPVVLSSTSLIEVTLCRGADSIGIAVDGINGEKLYLNQTRSITISPHRFKLISLPCYNYFQALREKLGWSGSLKKRSH